MVFGEAESDMVIPRVENKDTSLLAGIVCVSRLDFRRSLVSGLRPSLRGRSAGSFPEQRLVIEPIVYRKCTI